MFLVKSKKAQSILEYALLIAVVVAAILIMQVFVKRGFQGQLKDSAGRMGDQFSATETTTKQVVQSSGQEITDYSATTGSGTVGIGAVFTNTNNAEVVGTANVNAQAAGAYSVSTRTGGAQNVTSASRTSGVDAEINTPITDMPTDAVAVTGGLDDPTTGF